MTKTMNIESKAFVVQDIFNIIIEPLSTSYDFKSKPAYYSLIDSLIFYQRKGESKLNSKVQQNRLNLKISSK